MGSWRNIAIARGLKERVLNNFAFDGCEVSMKPVLAIAFTALLTGCVSYGGPALVPGQSTATDAEARLGEPAQQLKLANGDRALYFSRLPNGRAMYVVTVGPDGVMKSIEQRMNQASFARIVPNAWTRKEVSELLGPPGKVGRLERQQREWWEYRYAYGYPRILYVQFSDDGVVREMVDVADDEQRNFGRRRD